MSDPSGPAAPAAPQALSASSLSASSPTLRNRFRLRLLAVAAALVAVAVPTDRIVADAVGTLAEEQMATLAATTAAGVRDWFAERRELAMALAQHPVVRDDALGVLRGDAESAARHREHLSALAEQFEIDGFGVCDAGGTIRVAFDPRFTGTRVSGPLEEPLRRALAGECAISAPQPIDAQGASGAAIIAAAPLAEQGRVVGALFLRYDPRRSYMRIFEAARPGATGETYAIDVQGRLASRSRFFDEIRAAGLAPAGLDTAMLRFDVRDPGRSLAATASSDRTALAWTRAAEAVRTGTGAGSGGYRSYRGREVVGAWVLLPEHGLGVVSEMDGREAFRPLVRLRIVFGVLGLLLGGAAVAAVVMMRRSEAAARRAAKAEQALRELGQYRLDRKIGEGGMGAVYLATHRLLRRRTAVKLLKGEMTPEARERFEREVRITCSLTHPNTIAVYDYGAAADGTTYCAMEYLRGRDLQHLVKQHGPLPPARVLHLLAQAAGSLGEAHAAHLVHRDVKPANLFVCERGGLHDFVKVLDFGIARRYEPGAARDDPGTISGTPLYMAPECVLGRTEPDGRADLYSLGCVAWFLLTGRPVFERPTVVAALMAHVNDPLPSLAGTAAQPVPADLEAVVRRLLAKSPDDRPADADALLRELRSCADWGRWTNEDARAWWESHGGPESAADVPDDVSPSSPKVLHTQDLDARGADPGTT